MFTVIGAMRSDDTDVAQAVVFYELAKRLADFFAAMFFTLLARANVKDFSGCVFFFAHRRGDSLAFSDSKIPFRAQDLLI